MKTHRLLSGGTIGFVGGRDGWKERGGVGSFKSGLRVGSKG